ncbi:hypothetical protein FO519_001178 [Halicephalobus sp. NKZ332]|nr:hypothetical protein FO519_001178 [Halicephalobus sp. NKZ332]
MVVERSAFYHIRKQAAIWIYPAIAGTLIFLDWNHTPVNMGTFTLSYYASKGWARRRQFLFVPFVMYFGYCWDEAGRYKREMMKGQSRMFADRIQNIPKYADPWNY